MLRNTLPPLASNDLFDASIVSQLRDAIMVVHEAWFAQVLGKLVTVTVTVRPRRAGPEALTTIEYVPWPDLILGLGNP